MILDRIHKRDAISVASVVFLELTTVHNTVRYKSEPFSAFEAMFSAEVTRFNGLVPTLGIPDLMSYFYLISKAKVYDS